MLNIEHAPKTNSLIINDRKQPHACITRSRKCTLRCVEGRAWFIPIAIVGSKAEYSHSFQRSTFIPPYGKSAPLSHDSDLDIRMVL